MKHVALFLLVVISFIPRLAQADGGIVRARETRGPFVITIFTAAEIVTTAPVDISIMVQDRETNDVVMDAVVNLSFSRPNESTMQTNSGVSTPMIGHAMPGDSQMQSKPIIRATRAGTANKLLYGTNALLSAAGDWSLRVSVRRDRNEASVDCILPVAMSSGRLAAIWPYLALVPAVIALFVVNQWLRRRSAHSIATRAAQMNSQTVGI